MDKKMTCWFTDLMAAVLVLSAALLGPASGQWTGRASIDSIATEANGASWDPTMSADGRFVGFTSEAPNLVAADSNGCADVLVHDRINGLTERVSIASDGTQGNNASFWCSISADGRYIAFASIASNLVAGDTNGCSDVFIHDRRSGLTERVSVGLGGSEPNNESFFPSVSASGRYVSFVSKSSNLVVADSNSASDVFVYDYHAGLTIRVSISSSGTQGNGDSLRASISGDGRYVGFASNATNLVPWDTNGATDVFLYDLQNGLTHRASVDSSGGEGNDSSFFSAISADGRYLTFVSVASNLVSGDTNGLGDVFVHDAKNGLTQIASVSSGGSQGNDHSVLSSISANGRYVAFESLASNLVEGDTNGTGDIFVHDRQDGVTERVSVDSSGCQGDGFSGAPSVSADGRCIAFGSSASTLVCNDANNCDDIFVRDRTTITYTRFCIANQNSTGYPAAISARGSARVGARFLELTSTPVPNKPGVFFHGINQSQITFGSGFLCTTGNVVRGSTIAAVNHVATYIYDNVDAEHSLSNFVGMTRNFQYWFRDPMGGATPFNTSDAIAIQILP